MQIEISEKHGYQILRVAQEPAMIPSAKVIGKEISDRMAKGSTKFAITFALKTYPYSKLLSVLVHLDSLVKEQGGTLVVVQPNKSFVETLTQTKLDKVITIVSSVDELANLG